MHLLYEEEGEFKVGTVLGQAPASFQVESPHGRRSKVKAAAVLMRFERPGAGELLEAAGKVAAGPARRVPRARAEKKKRVLQASGGWGASLARFECPPEVASLKDELLYAPDRNKPETKA